jgi:hypothetical protein
VTTLEDTDSFVSDDKFTCCFCGLLARLTD